ncbi:hypothetical protein IQ07DRAFT_317865 [Pyrenochaeta sp. DS3sAY3a]|nr:hypothetical protein IQ07DRAFT_317865 [Pyrenochaeta sp. DS3sAY3a]
MRRLPSGAACRKLASEPSHASAISPLHMIWRQRDQSTASAVPGDSSSGNDTLRQATPFSALPSSSACLVQLRSPRPTLPCPDKPASPPRATSFKGPNRTPMTVTRGKYPAWHVLLRCFRHLPSPVNMLLLRPSIYLHNHDDDQLATSPSSLTSAHQCLAPHSISFLTSDCSHASSAACLEFEFEYPPYLFPFRPRYLFLVFHSGRSWSSAG